MERVPNVTIRHPCHFINSTIVCVSKNGFEILGSDAVDNLSDKPYSEPVMNILELLYWPVWQCYCIN
jgi:hypothetical protein